MNRKTIPGFSDYIISDSGKVFSKKCGTLRELSTYIGSRGYIRVGLVRDDGCRCVVSVHTLILLTFIGEKPDSNYMGLHVNDDKLNNNVANLKWGTFQDNMDDRVRNGRQKRGESVWTAKLNPKVVKEIRDLHKVMGYRRIAKLYGVAPNTVMYCVKRVSWRWVE